MLQQNDYSIRVQRQGFIDANIFVWLYDEYKTIKPTFVSVIRKTYTYLPNIQHST